MSQNKNQNSLTVRIPVSENSDAATTLSWVVRSFLCSVCESTLPGAPRRAEAHRTAIAMVVNANDTLQITSQQAHDIGDQLKQIEEKIYPGSSLL